MKKKIASTLAGLAAVMAFSSCQTKDITPEGSDIEPSEQFSELNKDLPDASNLTVQSYSKPEAPFEYDVEYEYDPTDFPNPERGPYSAAAYEFKDGRIPRAFTVEELARPRQNGITLIFTFFYYCDFMNDELTPEVLEVMRQHFINLRESGQKTVLRCAYSWSVDLSNITQQEPDASMIIRHIEQITPIIREFSDVIYVWQAGFVGTYGEWAYTSNVTTWDDKAAVIKAMLDALPQTRMIAMRTPRQKRTVMGILTGLDSKTSYKDTITAATAFNGSYNSRISSFNDCVFVNSGDGGTYADGWDRKQVKTESNYMMNGGESCYQGDNKYCECIPAYDNLRSYHWSYLSNHHDIINIWKEMGCYEDATARVGYRFVLNGASFDSDFCSGDDLTIRFCLTNYGWASLINPHDLEFIIVSDSDESEKYVFKSKTDPRIWKGSHIYTHTERIVLPESLKAGQKYSIYINIADSEDSLHDRAVFSVRFANKNIWDEKTGYNLMHSFIAN